MRSEFHVRGRRSRQLMSRRSLFAAKPILKLVEQVLGNITAQRRGAEGGCGLKCLRWAGSQSSGGNAMCQKPGHGLLNSTPTSVFPSSFCPRETTLQSCSFEVAEFVTETCSPGSSCVVSRSIHPCAFTDAVSVTSSKGRLDLFPRTITGIGI
jgi:hypothetical protein